MSQAQIVSELLRQVPDLRHHQIEILESISRQRQQGGHNRHFATQTKLVMVVTDIYTFLSGAQLQFAQHDQLWYGIALDYVVRFERHPTTWEIAEHFEQQTERLTRIRILASAPAVV